MLEISILQSELGAVAQVRNGGVSHAALMINDRLHAAMATFADRVAYNASQLQPEPLLNATHSDAQPVLRALHEAIDDAGQRAAENQAIWHRALTPPPSISRDRAPEYRALYRHAPIGDQAARVKQAPAEELAALLEAPDLAGLHEPLREAVRERALRLFHIDRAGTLANHRKQPSVDRIIATGPDREAAEAAAGEAVDRLRAETDRIEDAEASLQGVLTVLSIVTGWTREEVLERALAA